MSRPEKRLRLGIMAYEGCMVSSIASATDALLVASALARIRDPQRAPILEAVVFGARGQTSIRTSAGFDIGGLARRPDDLDMVLVPGIMHDSPSSLLQRVGDLHAEVGLLRQLAASGMRLAGVCSGTFLLAEAGVLDGRRATTSWWLGATMRLRYPRVRMEPDAMLVEDGAALTSGGATAVLDLVIRQIADVGGEELSKQTSRLLVLDTERQSQAPFVSEALLDKARDSMSERIERFLQRRLHQDIRVAQLASHCGISERGLLRHFQTRFGVAPLTYIQRLRVERAKVLLETTHLTLEEIVDRCGYADASSFRKLFRRMTTLTPGDYRSRFRLRSH